MTGIGQLDSETAIYLEFDLAGDRRKIGIVARSCVEWARAQARCHHGRTMAVWLETRRKRRSSPWGSHIARQIGPRPEEPAEGGRFEGRPQRRLHRFFCPAAGLASGGQGWHSGAD